MRQMVIRGYLPLSLFLIYFSLFSSLSFSDMDNFADLEQRKTIAQGRAAILNPPAVASYPRPQVTWFREGYKIIPNHRT